MIREVLAAARHPWLVRGGLGDVGRDLRALYPAGGEALVWFDGDRPSSALVALGATLAGVRDLGLDPADLDAVLIEGEVRRAMSGEPRPPRERALLDTAATVSAMRLLRWVHGGRVAPGQAGRSAELHAGRLDLTGLVGRIRETGRPGEVVASVEPPYPGYQELKRALARERKAPNPEPLPPLPRGRKVAPGAAWSGVPAMRLRLQALGDLAGDEATADRYDEPLVAAVKRFQDRHGIQADGVVGVRTWAAMNVPPARRVRQIELSLERWRWLPDPGDRAVVVEIPRAELAAVERGKEVPALRMRVVVGSSTGHSTPMLAAPIDAVVFHPYWVVPRKIVNEEVLPKERAAPGWMERHGMEVVERVGPDAEPLAPTEEVLTRLEAGELRLQQRPGPRNDLGEVKFVVLDAEGIELHGTPHRALFDQPRRDRSHGCIRLENPDGLAEWVLRPEAGWDAARIAAAKEADRPVTVKLGVPVPVLLVYATASADPDGTEHYRDDIYRLDEKLEAELRRAAPPPARTTPVR